MKKLLIAGMGKYDDQTEKLMNPDDFYNIIIILYSSIQRQNGRNRAENEQISERIN